MILDEKDGSRKSQDSQHKQSKRQNRIEATVEKFRVKRQARDWEVRLKHKFLLAWAHILNPRTFVVYCVLEMFADWRPGPKHGHTNGYISLAEVANISGTSRSQVQSSLKELESLGLVRFENPDPKIRHSLSTNIDLIVCQDAEPPKSKCRNIVTPTESTENTQCRPADVPGDRARPVPVTGHVLPGDRARPALSQGTSCPVTGHPLLVALDSISDSSLSSSSSLEGSVSEKPTTTTTAPPTLPDLTPLERVGNLTLDREATSRMWAEARAAAPSVTVKEVAQCMSAHLNLATLPGIDNPTAYLRRVVVNALSGAWLTRLREETTQRQAEASSNAAWVQRCIEAERARQALYHSEQFSRMSIDERAEAERAITHRYGLA